MAEKKPSRKRKTGADIPVTNGDEGTALVVYGNEDSLSGVVAEIDDGTYDDLFGGESQVPEPDFATDSAMDAEPVDDPGIVDVEFRENTPECEIDQLIDRLLELQQYATKKWMVGEVNQKNTETDEETVSRTVSEWIYRRKQLVGLGETARLVYRALRAAVDDSVETLDKRIFFVCENGTVSTERAKKYFKSQPLFAEINDD